MRSIRDLCVRWNAFAITDEIYEHMLYDGAQHISMATLDGMRERTITINALSKTYSVTGWRVGWAIAPPEVTAAIRKVHDFLTVGAAAPLQEAGAVAMHLPARYYESLAREYALRRDRLLGILTGAGFRCFKPRGAYYIMTDISALWFSRRRRLREISRHGDRRGGGSGFELLPPSCGRPNAPPLHVLQDGSDLSSRSRAFSEAAERFFVYLATVRLSEEGSICR